MMRDTDGVGVDVVGLLGGVAYGSVAVDALGRAEVVVGSERQFREVGASHGLPSGAERVRLAGPLDAVLDTVAARSAEGRRVCVLASGDPGFFGIVRALGERLGPDRLAVHPAPSSVAMAFARLGLSWDDAAVVSAHGRPLEAAVAAARQARAGKAAILTSPDNPPEAVGKALRAAGHEVDEVAVVSRIGDDAERVHRLDLDGLADGSFDPMSVVVVLASTASAAPRDQPGPGLAWGLPEDEFAHRGGMITKSEVRAVALGKLALPPSGVLWDVGAGSGSVAIECARLAPGLDVVAIDRDPEQASRVRANAAAHGVIVTVVAGDAPEAFERLPDPDRVFVGGGGIDVLDAALVRLRPGGVVVANYTLVDRAVAAHGRLGNLVQLSVSRAAEIGALGFRLAPENPVFVAWGPAADG
jgi:precorrin-6B C5,15-methyltransferase / cobalt-precorrin-6B C5,C15-methyltransferase